MGSLFWTARKQDDFRSIHKIRSRKQDDFRSIHKIRSRPPKDLRNLHKSWELMAPWTGAKVKVPVKFMAGDQDVIYTTPGTKEYVHGGNFKKDVPLLEDIVIMEGVAHFLNQERAEEVNSHIHDFIKKF